MKTLKQDFAKLPPEDRVKLFEKLWKIKPKNWAKRPSWINEAYKLYKGK